MSEFNRENVYTDDQDSLRSYIVKVFTKMGIAMAITAAVAFVCFMNLYDGGFLYKALVQMPFLMWIAMFAQIGVCIAFTAGLQKMQKSTVTILFYAYAALTGISFSFLPFAYGVDTVFEAFAFAAVMFISCAVIGHNTKVDLSKFSGLMFGALISLVLASIVGMIFNFSGFTLMISYVGVILFLVLTAWDMQKIKAYYYQLDDYNDMRSKMAIYSAFQLYLDFINIFLYVLRILGSRNRD